MKRNIHKNLLGLLKSKGVLAISGGLLLVSCGAQMGGYSETDGVYYDPNKDTLPEGVIINDSGNRVGEYYDYYQDSNVIQNAEANSREQQNRYNEWSGTNPNWGSNATDSDWGMYAGSQTNYYDNSWGWGSPWGWYGGYNPYWGWNRGWGWGGSLSWGWVVHSDGAGEALSDGVALTGDILLIGEDTMIRSGAATMEARGDTAATGVAAIMPLYTEEAERAEEVS